MRRQTLFAIGLLVLLLPLSTFVPTRAQSSDAPYIYYYSDEINAFIIERADGTDTRILGAGLMSPWDVSKSLPYIINGPGWSPSGKWFAWQYSHIEAQDDSIPYVIKSDGSQRLRLLDGLKNAYMAWAPHTDLLFVISQYFEFSGSMSASDVPLGYLCTNFFLIDVDANRTILSEKNVVYGIEANYREAPVITWVDDTRVVVEYTSEPASDLNISGLTIYFRTFDVLGESTESVIDNVLASTAINYPGAVSSLGTVAYLVNRTLFSTNLITGERRSYGKVTDYSSNIPTIYWSPDGRQAVIAGSGLWLLTVNSGKLTPILSTYAPPGEWADIPFLPWSPDSNQVLFISSGKVFHFAVTNQRLDVLPIKGETERCDCVGWLWTNNAEVLIHASPEDGSVKLLYLYDFNAATTLAVSLPPTSHDSTSGDLPDVQPAISPDRLHIAYMAEGPVVYDTQNHTEQALPPAARSWEASGEGEALWSLDSQWFMTFQGGLVAGGGQCCRHIGIVRADGTSQRDLSFVSFPVTDVTAGWLPPQVPLNYLPPTITRPLYPSPTKTFKGNNWSFELSWSPDGKHLLSYGGEWSSGSILEWDTLNGISTLAFVEIDNGHQLAWQQNPDGTYTPELVAKKNAQLGNLIVFATSPNGRQIFGYDRDTTLSGVYDAATYGLIQQVGSEFSNLTSASFSPDGRLLAFGGPFDTTQIWDTQTWSVVATLRYPAPAVAFSPDGKWLAASRSWDIDLWSVHELLAWGKPVF